MSGEFDMTAEVPVEQLRLKDLHPALREALCYRHTFRHVLDIPNHRYECEYMESTGVITFIVYHTTSLKTYKASLPYPFHKVSPGEFVKDYMYAQDLWDERSTEAEREDAYRASFVGNHVDHLQASMLAKGFDCKRTKLTPRLVSPS